MAKFAVRLHADNLLLADEGGTAFGGVHVWRVVRAKSEDEAIALAERRLERELRARPEVVNGPLEPLGVSTEECRKLRFLSMWRGSGFVFYVDTDDPRNAVLVAPPN
jgi:hypothetical protein